MTEISTLEKGSFPDKTRDGLRFPSLISNPIRPHH